MVRELRSMSEQVKVLLMVLLLQFILELAYALLLHGTGDERIAAGLALPGLVLLGILPFFVSDIQLVHRVPEREGGLHFKIMGYNTITNTQYTVGHTFSRRTPQGPGWWPPSLAPPKSSRSPRGSWCQT